MHLNFNKHHFKISYYNNDSTIIAFAWFANPTLVVLIITAILIILLIVEIVDNFTSQTVLKIENYNGNNNISNKNTILIIIAIATMW